MTASVWRVLLMALVMVAACFATLATGDSDPDNSDPDGSSSDDRGPEWYRITGLVVDSDGSPVGGASLFLAPDWNSLDPEGDGDEDRLWKEDGWAQTGNDGSFRLDARAGDYRLDVYAPGYFPHNEALTVVNDTALTLTLAPIPAHDATLRLTVTGPEAFSATLRDSARNWYVASAWGEDEVLLEGWAGDLELEVNPHADGYLLHRQTVTLTAGEETALALTLEPYVESATLAGFALDQHGNGVAQARVTLALPDVGYRATTLTAADGSYSLAAIPGDYHQFSATAFAHTFVTPAVETVVLTENETAALDLTLTAKALDFEQAGVVVDRFGEPMADITVTAWGRLYEPWYYDYEAGLRGGTYGYSDSGDWTTPGQPFFGAERVEVAETTTDADGRFTLLLPEDESLEIEATADGYIPAATWVWTYTYDSTLGDDDEPRGGGSNDAPWWEVRLVLYPAPDVALSGTVTLPDGTVVEGAWLTFHRDYQPPTKGQWIAAVWQHVDVEGGCWYQESDDGERYEVVESADGVTLEREEGEREWVLVEGVDVATTCQVGKPVRILDAGDADATLPGTDANEWSYNGGWNARYYGDTTFTGADGGYELALYSGTYAVEARYSIYDDYWYFAEDGVYDPLTGTAGKYRDDSTRNNPLGPPVRAPENYRFTGEVILAPGAQTYDIVLEQVIDDATLTGTVTLSDGTVAGDGSGSGSGDNSGTAGRTFYVSVSGPDYQNRTLVRDGEWSVNLPHDQIYTYSIWSDDPLVAKAWGYAKVGAEGTITTVSDELKVTVLDSTLKGTVTYDGEPVAGATVTVWGVGIGPADDAREPQRDDIDESSPTLPPGVDTKRKYDSNGQSSDNYDPATGEPGSPNGWSDDPDDAAKRYDEKPYYGPSYTRTVITDADGKFSLPVAGGQLYSVEASYWDDKRDAITDDYVPSLYGAFRHVYVDYDVSVEIKLPLKQQPDDRNRDRDDVWWETTDKAPRELDAAGNAVDEDWRDAKTGDAAEEEFPFRLAVEWPPRDGNVPVVLTDPDGTPAAGLEIVVFRDGEEYATAITDSEGYAEVELGDPEGHDYAFEARAGDQVMAYVAMEQTDPESDALPAMGALAAVALLGLVAVRRRCD